MGTVDIGTWKLRLNVRPGLARGLLACALISWMPLPPASGYQEAQPADSEKPAEPAPEPTPAQAPEQPASDDEAGRMKRRNETDAIKPTTGPSQSPAAPAKPAAGPRAPESGIPVPVARRAREGIFIIKQRGELMVARTGDVIFIPDKGSPARTSRPMVLLPSQTLARLESAAGLRVDSAGVDSPARARATLSGQVTVYRQREYLLPTTFQIELVEPAKPAEASGATTVHTPTPTRTPAPADNSDAEPESAPTKETIDPDREDRDAQVETLIRELEDRRTANRGLSRDAGRNPEPPPAAPGADAKAPDEKPAGDTGATDPSGSEAARSARGWPMAEGSVITARRGRLIRLSDGSPGISFDNAATSPAGARRVEAPMALLPSQIVQRMEEVVGGRGDRAAIEISGRVFTYSGRNYLLPTMYQVLPPSDVGPLN
ncbi:MAG: hypothetical protein IT435_20365 [Phycisphaerales bacterium]|nr:hypothetical protein [Phycisphaerales bacterium]